MRELKIAAALLVAAGLVIATTPEATSQRSARASESRASTNGVDTSPGIASQGDADVAAGTASAPQAGPEATSSGAAASGPSTSGGSSQDGSGGGAAHSANVGPGITDKTITIGIGWFDVNGAVAAFGSPGQYNGTSPTTREGAQRIIDWMNKHGGIAGRTIVPVYHEYPINDLATNDSRDRQEQAMCADFTEDHHAFAAIPYEDGQGVFYECAAKHGLIGLSTFTGAGAIDEKLFDQIGHTFWAPNWINGERRERIVVEQLNRRGFFTPGARVGLFLSDTPPARRTAESTLKPMLKKLGVNVVAEIYAKDLSDPWSSYIFQLQSAGVTHIVGGQSSCGAGICLALIQQAAENQRYRPKYGVGSDWGPAQAKLYAPPSAQMANTMSIGWTPRTDLGNDDYDVAKPINDHDARCRQIIKDSGLKLAMHLVTPYCDGLFFLEDGLARASDLTWQGFRQAIEGAGTGLEVGTAYGTNFGPGRHDGASFVRDTEYDPDTQTWHYIGPLIPIG